MTFFFFATDVSMIASAALDDAICKARTDELTIPFGVGIAGMVAESKEMINIKDAYNDPRFNCEIDLKTGYKTNLMLSMPICNYEGDVIGVAQIINKTDGQSRFTILIESGEIIFFSFFFDFRVARVYRTGCGNISKIFNIFWDRYPKCTAVRNVNSRISTKSNFVEFSTKYIRRTK